MSEVISEIGEGTDRDALNFPIAGMLQKVLIMPGSTLDPRDTTHVVKSTDSLVTDIVPTVAGFVFDGIGDSDFMTFDEEGVEDEGRDGFILTIGGIKILDPSTEKKENVKDMKAGGGINYCVFQRKWQGTLREDAFYFGGFFHGLKVMNYKFNSLENQGVITFDLQTPPNRSEPFGWMNYLKTNYATTETDVWTNKLG